MYDEEDGCYRSISRCMTFSDAMYEATREFYFHGTPYPEGVGLVEGAAKTKASKNDGEAKPEGDESGGDDVEDADNHSDTGKDDEGDIDFVGVNCFPGRPSSSLYVTNESPSIWFQPKEVWEVRATAVSKPTCMAHL